MSQLSSRLISLRSITSLLLAGAGMLALAGCSSAEADPRTQPQLVRTATLAMADGGGRDFTGIV